MAKYTPNLGLYEKEATDGSDTFNIQTMLNNNFDKIDENVALKTELVEMKNQVNDNLLSHQSDNSKQIPHLGTTTNIGDSYSITTTETINTNQKFTIKFNVASTSAPTLKINTGTAYAIKKANSNNAKLFASVYTLFWDGLVFTLLGEGGEYGTVTADKVVTGYTYGTDNELANGTMPIKSGITYTPTTSDQTISIGYEDGTCKVKGDANLISPNLKAGITCFNITGKNSVVDTEDATAIATQIRNGQSAYINGNKVTGTNPVQATTAQTVTPGTSNIVKPAGIYDGAITIQGDANLISANLKANTTVFNILGTCIPQDTTLEHTPHFIANYSTTLSGMVVANVSGSGWLIAITNTTSSSSGTFKIAIDGIEVIPAQNMNPGGTLFFMFRYNTKLLITVNGSNVKAVYTID